MRTEIPRIARRCTARLGLGKRPAQSTPAGLATCGLNWSGYTSGVVYYGNALPDRIRSYLAGTAVLDKGTNSGRLQRGI